MSLDITLPVVQQSTTGVSRPRLVQGRSTGGCEATEGFEPVKPTPTLDPFVLLNQKEFERELKFLVKEYKLSKKRDKTVSKTIRDLTLANKRLVAQSLVTEFLSFVNENGSHENFDQVMNWAVRTSLEQFNEGLQTITLLLANAKKIHQAAYTRVLEGRVNADRATRIASLKALLNGEERL